MWLVECLEYLGSENIILARPGENVPSKYSTFVSGPEEENSSESTISIDAQPSWRHKWYPIRAYMCY